MNSYAWSANSPVFSKSPGALVAISGPSSSSTASHCCWCTVSRAQEALHVLHARIVRHLQQPAGQRAVDRLRATFARMLAIRLPRPSD
jgi:hypothetical protein